ncbi:MAG: glycoside hydrolase family 113 [Lacipirellulaceae bacterium]
MPALRDRPRSTAALALAAITLLPAEGRAADGVYETNADPRLGFNLISWWDGTTSAHWADAVQRVHDAGFREVSLSPLRFVDIDSGNLLTDAQATQGSPLASLVGGLQRATQLGMKVTLNPFIEPYDASENQYFADIPGTNGCTWRGCWNPTGSIRTTFFTQYQTYLTDVAALAQQHNVERMTVGTELNGLDGAAANVASWNTVINAVDAVYSGPIGYSANWDRFAFGNPTVTTQAIFDHPAIDFVGVDSYFTNVVNNTAADASGAYDPNNPFVDTVEAGWQNLLSTRLLPYAAARRGGAGLPLVFTEFGHLPRNRTAVDPQQQAQTVTQALDTAEQRMAFEGFLNAIDGRQDLIPAVHVWQWAMTGSDGSAWNINPANTSSGTTNTNRDLALWLQAYVGTAALAGDYNADGRVNAADYTMWRDLLGSSGGPADGDRSGLVDQADYNYWRTYYGDATAVASTGSAVPEPLGCGLLAVGATLLLLSARNRRST